MTDPYAPADGAGSAASSRGRSVNSDGWGPATSVRAGSGGQLTGSARANSAYATAAPGAADDDAADADDWQPAGPVSGRDQRATRRAERSLDAYRGPSGGSAHGFAGGPAGQANNGAARNAAQSVEAIRAASRSPERGLPWWAAVLLLIVIAGIGGVIDTVGSIQVKGGFNIGIVAASVIAILVVKRPHMFPVVVAPPIVYSLAALLQLYIRSGGLHDKKVVFDAAANYLVYGFPAIAAACAAVLIIAGIRLISRK